MFLYRVMENLRVDKAKSAAALLTYYGAHTVIHLVDSDSETSHRVATNNITDSGDPNFSTEVSSLPRPCGRLHS
jgi:hypothetical protein